MLRKFMLLLVMGLALISSVSMADTTDTIEDAVTLTPNEIKIAEPIRDHVFLGKAVYVTVNILDASYYEMLAEHPLTIQVVKFEDTLPFADELGDTLNVPVVKLSSSAAKEWLMTSDSGDTITLQTESGTYAKETEIINQYFLQLELINEMNLKIEAEKNKYHFDLAMSSESAATEEIINAYNKYLSDLDELFEMEQAFKNIQSQYLKLFEVSYLDGVIDSPSYSRNIGELNEGNYRIRIYDNDGYVIKAFSFKVMPQSEEIETILSESRYSTVQY